MKLPMNADERRYTLADAWHLSNRVNLMLLDNLRDEQLAVAHSPRSRNVADQFAHLHNVRIMWLETLGPAAVKGLKKIEKGKAAKAALKEALKASGKVLGDVIAEAEQAGKMKGYKRGPAAFFGYAMAHEAHHRGQIILHVKYAKLPIDTMFGYGLWEWGKL